MGGNERVRGCMSDCDGGEKSFFWAPLEVFMTVYGLQSHTDTRAGQSKYRNCQVQQQREEAWVSTRA
jgi:hypothetical protein